MAPKIIDNVTRLKGFNAALKDDTDFKIVVGEYFWDVHEDVLVSQSTFFKILARGPWEESRDRSVTLTNEDVWMVARMVQFFYGDAFAWSHSSTIPVKKIKAYMEKGVRRFKTIKGTLPALTTLMHPFSKNLDFTQRCDQDQARSDVEKFGCMYVLADKYGCEGMRSYVLRRFDQYVPIPASLPKAFSGIFGELIERDERLRAIVASHLARCYKDLRAVQRTSDWLELWLASDTALAMLVMDRMIPVEKATGASQSQAAKPLDEKKIFATVPSARLGFKTFGNVSGCRRLGGRAAFCRNLPRNGTCVCESESVQGD